MRQNYHCSEIQQINEISLPDLLTDDKSKWFFCYVNAKSGNQAIVFSRYRFHALLAVYFICYVNIYTCILNVESRNY